MKQRLDSLLDPWCGQFIIWNHPMKFPETPKNYFQAEVINFCFENRAQTASLQAFEAILSIWSQGQVKDVVCSCFLPSPYNLISVIPEGKTPKHSLKSGPNGCHVPVQAAFGPADVQGQGPLEQAGEDLDLVRTAVFGYFKPLHQKLRKRDRHTMPPWTFLNFKPHPQTRLFRNTFLPHQWLCSSKQSLLAESTRLQSFPKSQQQETQTAIGGTCRRNTHLYPDVMWGHLWWTGLWLALLWGC